MICNVIKTEMNWKMSLSTQLRCHSTCLDYARVSVYSRHSSEDVKNALYFYTVKTKCS